MKFWKRCFALFLVLVAWLSPAESSAQTTNRGKGLMIIEEMEMQERIPLKALQTEESYRGLPSAVSLKKYCPTPADQGTYGTCVGWTTAYAARTILEARQLDLRSQAEIDKLVFSPGFIYKLIKTDTDPHCTNGGLMVDALLKMKLHGVPKKSSFPRQCIDDYVSERVYKEAENYKLKDFVNLWHPTYDKKKKIEIVKQSLVEGNPVVVGVFAPPSIYEASQYWQPTEEPKADWGGHALCVVGYDEKRQAFEVMNSWGTSWANEGFTWIKYSTFADFVVLAYELIPYYKPKKKRNLLVGGLRIELESGQNTLVRKEATHEYSLLQKLNADIPFRLYLSNQEPAYVYAFATDQTKKVSVIFPHKSYVSPFLPYHKGEIAFPDQEHYLRLDDTEGEDELCIIFSRYPLSIDDIYQKVSNRTTSLKTSLEQALGNKLISQNEVSFAPDRIAFSSPATTGTATFFIIKLKRPSYDK